MAPGAGGKVRVGEYVVDLDGARLTKGGAAIPIAFRHFQALRLLVEAHGNVVSKDEFLRQIWPDQEVDESNLTHCIAQLRKTLNGGQGGSAYVETVPRIGYRLDAPVLPVDEAPATAPPMPSRGRRFLWMAICGVIALGVSGWFAWQKYQIRSEADAAHKEGQRFRRQRDPAGLTAAVESYRKAIRLDPSNAVYYSSLAEALVQIPAHQAPDNRLLRETAEKSVALDPKCSGCNALLGFVLFSRYWEWARAESHLRTALAAAPEAAGIHGYLAMLTATQGRLDEAVRHADEATRREPYLASLHTIRAGVLYFAGRYADARAEALLAVSLGQAQPTAWDWIAYSLAQQRSIGDAFAEAARSGAQSYPRDVHTVYRKQGLAAAVQRILDTTHALDGPDYRAYRRAHWRMIAGDEAGALDELETAYRVRMFDTMYIAVDPMFEPLREHPRFQTILRDMNLPQAVRTQSAR